MILRLLRINFKTITKAVIMKKQKINYWLLRIKILHITFILRKKK